MSSRANRLRKLETSVIKLSTLQAARNRTTLLTVNCLIPQRLFEALQKCLLHWGEDYAGLESYVSSFAPAIPHLAFNPENNPYEAWILLFAKTPENGLIPKPPEGTSFFLFQKANLWEHIFEEYAGHPEAQNAALCQQGFFYYFACLAQEISS